MKFLRQFSEEHSCLGNFRDTKFSLLCYTFSLRCKSPYSVQMWENTDQENSEYEHFVCSVPIHSCSNFIPFIFQFYTPWKPQKTRGEYFRGYRNGTFVWIGFNLGFIKNSFTCCYVPLCNETAPFSNVCAIKWCTFFYGSVVYLTVSHVKDW